MGKSINDLLIFLFFQALTDAFLYAKSVIHYLSVIYFAANILNKKKVSKNYPLRLTVLNPQNNPAFFTQNNGIGY